MNLNSQGPFRGRFEIKLDPKGRLSLPPSLRHGASAKSQELVITNSRYRGQSCLDVYSHFEWTKLEQKISRLPSLKAEVQAFNRFYLSAGQAVEVDMQSRILIPQSLRRFAGLDGEVVLVGLGSKFEIWAEDTWSHIHKELVDGFENTLEAVAALEITSDGGTV